MKVIIKNIFDNINFVNWRETNIMTGDMIVNLYARIAGELETNTVHGLYFLVILKEF